MKKESIKCDIELTALIEKYLEKDLDELWYTLTPEERHKVFNKLLTEYMVALIDRKAKEHNLG
jgi:hypothetical protein